MKYTFVTALTLTAYAFAKVNPDAFKSFEDIVSENGYVSENYTLTTPDDYNISIYRIPGTADDKDTKKPAVLIIHA